MWAISLHSCLSDMICSYSRKWKSFRSTVFLYEACQILQMRQMDCNCFSIQHMNETSQVEQRKKIPRPSINKTVMTADRKINRQCLQMKKSIMPFLPAFLPFLSALFIMSLFHFLLLLLYNRHSRIRVKNICWYHMPYMQTARQLTPCSSLLPRKTPYLLRHHALDQGKQRMQHII